MLTYNKVNYTVETLSISCLVITITSKQGEFEVLIFSCRRPDQTRRVRVVLCVTTVSVALGSQIIDLLSDSIIVSQ